MSEPDLSGIRIKPASPERIRELLGADLLSFEESQGEEAERYLAYRRQMEALAELKDDKLKGRARDEWAHRLLSERPELVDQIGAVTAGEPLQFRDDGTEDFLPMVNGIRVATWILAADIESNPDFYASLKRAYQFLSQTRSTSYLLITFLVAVSSEKAFLDAAMSRLAKGRSHEDLEDVLSRLTPKIPDLEIYRQSVRGDVQYAVFPGLLDPLQAISKLDSIAHWLPTNQLTLGDNIKGLYAGSFDPEKAAADSRLIFKAMESLDPAETAAIAERAKRELHGIPRRPKLDTPLHRWWIRYRMDRTPNSLNGSVWQSHIGGLRFAINRQTLMRDIVRTAIVIYRCHLIRGKPVGSLEEVVKVLTGLSTDVNRIHYTSNDRRLWIDSKPQIAYILGP